MYKFCKNLATFYLLLVIGMVYHQSMAMVYEEPLNIEDLDSLFSDDDCIQGTLSTSESGSPLIKSISFIDVQAVNIENNDFNGKSPMSLLSELATFNKIKYQYILKEEYGPPHKKKFLISLLLGKYEYVAEGSSIKRAQHEAAKLALNSTTYEHPPTIIKSDNTSKLTSRPVHKLNEWAGKHSGVTIIYSFIQQSKVSHSNINHKNMYCKSENIHKVTVTVGSEQFTGEGYSAETAKQNAAANALKHLQSAEGFCMFDDGMKSVFGKLFSPDSESDSHVSLLYEFASKSKLQLSFDLVREEGPSHIKKFVYKCSMDKFETFGEGSSKKSAKTEAARNMLEELKSHSLYSKIDCGSSLMKRKPKKKKSRNLIKSVTKLTQDDGALIEISDDMNPISKLFQIQQQKHDVEPIFNLVGEDNHDSNNRFSVEVTVGELSFVGHGTNKKTAKRKAAEGMLERLGYSTISGKTRLFSSDFKKKEFSDVKNIAKKKPLVPGLNINSEKLTKFDDSPIKDKSPELNKKSQKSKDESRYNEDKKSTSIKPKTELQKLAQQLGFRFQFSDFPKLNNTGYVSLISLTTDPPQVCYGTGVTTEQSQDRASLSALGHLYKNQLNTISQMLREPSVGDPTIKDFYMVDGDILIKNIISKETE